MLIDVDESIIMEALKPEEVVDNFEAKELLAFMETEEILEFLTERGIDFLKDVSPENLVAVMGKENILDTIEPEDVISHYGEDELLDIIISNRRR